jgi:hypothetical protein
VGGLMDIFAPGRKKYSAFVVRNISPQNKTITIFQYPINMYQTRDILSIPGVSDSDIKSSLLKGEILNKFLVGDIELVFSDIDLLQFSSGQRDLLYSFGFTRGVQVDSSALLVLEQQDIQLSGTVDGVNTIFTLPGDISWIQSPPYKIIVYKNGVKQVLGDDYFISESGPGTGYNTITFTIPPTVIPLPPDVMTADYYVTNK